MKRTIEFASHPANLLPMREFVREFVGGCGFSEREATLIVLGLDEACTNVIRHAYNLEESHLITLSCEKLASGVRFRLRDYGKPCDPTALKGRPLDMVQPGGLGPASKSPEVWLLMASLNGMGTVGRRWVRG